MFTRIYRTIFVLVAIGFFLWLGTQNLVLKDEMFLEWEPGRESRFISSLYPKARVVGLVQENGEFFSKIRIEPVYFFVFLPKAFNKAKVRLIYQSNLPISIGLMYHRKFPLDWRFNLKHLREDKIEGGSWKSGQAEFDVTSDFFNSRNRIKGLEFMISAPGLYQKGEDIKLKKIEILLKKE